MSKPRMPLLQSVTRIRANLCRRQRSPVSCSGLSSVAANLSQLCGDYQLVLSRQANDRAISGPMRAARTTQDRGLQSFVGRRESPADLPPLTAESRLRVAATQV